MSANQVLTAEKRETTNTGSVRKLRKEGKVPAIIYGNNKGEIKVSIDEKELTITHRKGGFFSKVIDLDIAGEKVKVLPQDIQFHPVKETPVHADFLRVDENSRVKVSVPIKFSGSERSPGIKRGGVLNAVRRAVDVYCKVKDIPESFTADISSMRIRDNIKFSNLNVPEGIEPVIKGRDFTIAAIAGRVSKEDSKAAETSGEESSEEDSNE